jgi:hypothetical protein
MKSTARLARLSARVRAARPAPADTGPVTDDDWLTGFEAAHAEGLTAAEPDFLRALAEYQSAIAADRASGIPPRRPSAAGDSPVGEKWDWLAEMYCRALGGEPPTSEAEFDELAAWFGANADRLYREVGQVLDLADGGRVSVADLRCGVAYGPRASQSGEVADQLRRARQRYG